MASDLTYSKPTRRKKAPGITARYRAKRRRIAVKDHSEIRTYVFQREQDICRCCRIRRADSMHELKPRGRGGKVSKTNSVAVCGQLVGTEPCCHTYLQLNQIDWKATPEGAQGLLQFRPTTPQAAEWMRVERYQWVCSMPGGRNDELEAC